MIQVATKLKKEVKMLIKDEERKDKYNSGRLMMKKEIISLSLSCKIQVRILGNSFLKLLSRFFTQNTKIKILQIQ